MQFVLQELDEIRKSGMKNFRNIQVDESNILTWQGLIVPVSIMMVLLHYCFRKVFPLYFIHQKTFGGNRNKLCNAVMSENAWLILIKPRIVWG